MGRHLKWSALSALSSKSGLERARAKLSWSRAFSLRSPSISSAAPRSDAGGAGLSAPLLDAGEDAGDEVPRFAARVEVRPLAILLSLGELLGVTQEGYPREPSGLRGGRKGAAAARNSVGRGR